MNTQEAHASEDTDPPIGDQLYKAAVAAHASEWQWNPDIQDWEKQPAHAIEVCWCGQEMSKHDMSHDPKAMPAQ